MESTRHNQLQGNVHSLIMSVKGGWRMELRKAIYNEAFIQQLKIDLAKAEPRFKADEYQSIILQSDWEQLELMQRKRRITEAIHATLPASYQEALDILMQVAPNYSGLAGLVFSDYVQVYGLNDWEVSIKALERFTQYSTAEFAVRPFFIKDSERMIQQSMTCTKVKMNTCVGLRVKGAVQDYLGGSRYLLLKRTQL